MQNEIASSICIPEKWMNKLKKIRDRQLKKDSNASIQSVIRDAIQNTYNLDEANLCGKHNKKFNDGIVRVVQIPEDWYLSLKNLSEELSESSDDTVRFQDLMRKAIGNTYGLDY